MKKKVFPQVSSQSIQMEGSWEKEAKLGGKEVRMSLVFWD